MQLFGSQGFRGTSVAAIERAAGLTPGAGGLYHHFPSKDAVLKAGLQRHLSRLGALHDVRRLFAGVGDLRVELTLTARYVLRELDAEGELLQILLTEGRSRPSLVADAAAALADATLAEFTAWLVEDWSVPPEKAGGTAVIALGALFSYRLLGALAAASGLDDESFAAAWADTFFKALQP